MILQLLLKHIWLAIQLLIIIISCSYIFNRFTSITLTYSEEWEIYFALFTFVFCISGLYFNAIKFKGLVGQLSALTVSIRLDSGVTIQQLIFDRDETFLLTFSGGMRHHWNNRFNVNPNTPFTVGLGPSHPITTIDDPNLAVFAQRRSSTIIEGRWLSQQMARFLDKYDTPNSVLELNNTIASVKTSVAIQTATNGQAIGLEYAQGYLSSVFALVTRGQLSSRNARVLIDPQLVRPLPQLREIEGFFGQLDLISSALSNRPHPKIFPKSHVAVWDGLSEYKNNHLNLLLCNPDIITILI